MTDLVAVLLHSNEGHALLKPLLMPLLIVNVISVKASREKIYVLAALLLSFLGDVFLIFEQQHPLFFIFGLVSFLLAHIFYILFFLGVGDSSVSLLKQFPWIILLVFIYDLALLYLLFPSLGGLKIPVTAYAVILSCMLLAALHSFNKIALRAGRFLVTGAAMFVLSDSLLAIQKFYSPFLLSGFFIMATYCLAQYFIVKGFIFLKADQ
ncbi:MAG: lysoplasmalogenase [Ferruginibacter sp.]|nr:lysoplasmalogenase [Ferruginibacter sp.]